MRQGENTERYLNVKPNRTIDYRAFMAERQGFEPWVPVKGQRFSRPPRSTTPAPLHAGRLSFLKPTCKWFFIAVHADGISTWHFPGTRS